MGNSATKEKLFKDQDYNKIISKCRKENKLFEDPEFLISRALLARDSLTQDFRYLGRSWNSREIEWLRPHQICDQHNQSTQLDRDKGRFTINR